ncbi:alpha/beta fold hydrolase [Sphingomonas bacterium]|uniref:alpha/beta fold hydrolase n=1 Tax=Sphingomonas bacterium TaxID=1895847 RepID=UPI001575AA95|nr:alpha/beta fold hydrolase [Sphingomonas bacterium]
MADMVLVHGMFQGGWSWDRLTPALTAAGHRTHTPDLAGCGSDTTPVMECTLERWTSDVAQIVAAQPEPVVLVGHSRGGLIVSQVAERVPDKVAAIVYLTALMLPDGASTMDLPQIIADEGVAMDGEMLPPRFSEDGLFMLPPLDPDEHLHHGYSDEDRAWSTARLGKEPVLAMATPLSLSAERYGRVPKVYVETSRDRTLPLGAQRAMIARGKPDEVTTVDADHMLIVTHVPQVAAILNDVAQRYAS